MIAGNGDRNAQMRRFLRFLIMHKVVSIAARKSRISVPAVYKWKSKYPLFKAAMQDVLDGAKDKIQPSEVYDCSTTADISSERKVRMKKFIQALSQETCKTIELACSLSKESRGTIYRWRGDYPEFDEAIEQILIEKTLSDRDLAAKLAEEAKAREMIPAIPAEGDEASITDKAIMENFIAAFPVNKWNITRTCQQIGVSTAVIFRLRRDFPEFETAMKLSRIELVDKAESRLIQHMEDTKNARVSLDATKFILDSQGKDRGYGIGKGAGGGGGDDDFSKEQLAALNNARAAIKSGSSVTVLDNAKVIECQASHQAVKASR